MGLLQNYLGLERAYKDGYDLPLLGMMKWYCIEIGRALTASDLGTKGTHFAITGQQSTHNIGGAVMSSDPSKRRVAAGPKPSRCVNLNRPSSRQRLPPFRPGCGAVSVCFRMSPV
jgi:hypothetical protein